jgi:hypothetical protein
LIAAVQFFFITPMTGFANRYCFRNGWDVVLSFGDTHAVVSHIKWEETMPAAFKLCWQLDYVFDKVLTAMFVL